MTPKDLDDAPDAAPPETWRSLEERAGLPAYRAFAGREFPENASEWDDGVSRRGFFNALAASAALAGLTACTRQPREAIVPYVKQPENVVPGRPLFYATAFTHEGFGTGLLVESHTGRPTKIEGNPDHPASLGATDLFAQASILSLYDPDRSQTPLFLGTPSTFGKFAEAMAAKMGAFRALGGEGLRVLTQTVTSPTLAEQLAALGAAMPKMVWHAYEPAGRHQARAGARAAFAQAVETRFDFAKADVVVALDADPFTEGPGSLPYAREFARRRREAFGAEAPHAEGDAHEPEARHAAPAVRFFSAESAPTLSGTLADHRLAVPAREVGLATAALAAELGVAGAVRPALSERAAKWVAAAAADLKRAAGASIVVAGEFAAVEIHVLAQALNEALGNVGKTVFRVEPVEASPGDQLASLTALVADMAAGKVDTLLVLGGNPVFDAPADLDFAAAFEKVKTRVRLSPYVDETSRLCHWHLPEAHFLEAWSDVRAFDGTASIVQPLIEPLYGGKSVHEVLSALLDPAPRAGLEIVKATWAKRRGGDAAGFESFWRRALHDGTVPGTAAAPRAAAVDPAAVGKAAAALAAAPAPAAGTYELSLRPDPGIHDGRFANNGWLQEVPRPFSKLTWDNAAYVSVATAKALSVPLYDPAAFDTASHTVLALAAGGRSVEVPVWVMPGHADGAITLHFGHGRTYAGRVGSRTGVNVYPIRTSAAPWTVAGVAARTTGRTVPLASTQHHFNMEGRNLVRTATAAALAKNPALVHEMEHAPGPGESLYPPVKYEHHAWGMAIDLGSCTGCNACVVACQAENNIPVVGKDQVRRGREMHWIRIDRYYEGAPETAVAHHQPVLCMHCENAPCEVVCPVAATSHSEEGVNEMTYNRCIGTKYCSNNCPYKVRRFNFFNFNAEKESLPVLALLANPNVTVRGRGVMEKCTYCIQRINAARLQAEIDGRKLKEGDVVTACQQVCPTEAIVFGDVNDPASRVSKRRKSALHYGILEHLNTRPRTTYLAKVTNPAAALERPEGEPEEPGYGRMSPTRRHA